MLFGKPTTTETPTNNTTFARIVFGRITIRMELSVFVFVKQGFKFNAQFQDSHKF